MLHKSRFAAQGFFLFLAILSEGVSKEVFAQGLTATVAPEYARAQWNGSVGLENTNLFGAGASLGFGRFVHVRASYKRVGSLRTSLGGSGYGGGSAEENSLDLSLLSTDVQLRLGTGRVAPLILGGGGVVGFSPDDREDVQQVAVGFGGGVDAQILPWLSGQLLAQNLLFRLDRSTIAGDASGAGVAPDPDSDDVRRSWTFSASLGARLGGGRSSSAADQLDNDMTRALSGGDGLMVPVELQAGVVRFADALAIDDQALLGLRGGLDFGPYFGIRGSYSRGLTSGPISVVGMSAWTGEAQFNVGRVTGASPHLLLGFGQMTFWGDFTDDSGLRPEDKDALIVGAGFGLPLWDRTRLVVSLRDYITSPGAVSGVSSTSDLRHNFGLSAGLSFNLRRSRPQLGVPPGQIAGGPEPSQAPPVSDSTSVAAPAPQPAAAPQTTSPQTAPQAAQAADTAAAGRPTNYQSDRTVVLPIPLQGQLIVRYGPEPVSESPPSTAGTDAGRQPAAAADSTAADSATVAGSLTPADLADLEQRLTAQITAAIASLDQARVADSVASAGVPTAPGTDSLDVVTRADLEAMEARLTQALAATVRDEAMAAALDSSAVTSIVRSELAQAQAGDSAQLAAGSGGPTADVLTRSDLEALEARLTEALTASQAAPPTDAADSTASVTRADLQALEARLTEAVSGNQAPPSSTVDSATIAALVRQQLDQQATPDRDEALDDLSQQVEELAALVRQRGNVDVQAVAPPPVTVTTVAAGAGPAATNLPGGPVFRGVSGHAGPARIRDSGTGLGVAVDGSFFSMWSNRIHPYLGLQFDRVPVQGVVGSSPYAGDVTSIGGTVGGRLDLATVGPVHGALNLGLVGIGGGTSGDTPAQASVVDDLYSGFVMGPKVSIDLRWQPANGSRWSFLSTVGRTWAGARGGWSFHVGFQWRRGGVSTVGRPLFVTGAPALPPESETLVGGAADTGSRTADADVADPVPAAAPATAAPDTAVARRLAELEAALQEERVRRTQTELAVDSLAEAAQAERARADSLRAANEAAEAAAREERERVAARRAALLSDLESFVGVVTGVQSVRQTGRGLEIVLAGELFASGATALGGPARAGVVRVGQRLAQVEEFELLVEGHTDATGPAETNMAISLARAEEVRGVLLEAGVSPGGVEVVGSGEGSPIAGNDTAEGRALNRRVEVVLVDFPEGG